MEAFHVTHPEGKDPKQVQLVDTPGFNNSEEREADAKIVEKIVNWVQDLQ